MKFKWIYGMKGYFNKYKIFTNQVIDVLKKERKLRNKSIRRVRVNLDETDSVVSHLRREMIVIKDDLKLHDLSKKNLLNYITRLESSVHAMILKSEKLDIRVSVIEERIHRKELSKQ